MFKGLGQKFKELVSEEKPAKNKTEEYLKNNSFPDVGKKESTVFFTEKKTVKEEQIEQLHKSNTSILSSEQVKKVSKIYEEVFKSLNGPGIDLYEVYTSVEQSDPNFDLNNKSIVEVIINTFKTVDPNLTREKLITSANEYLEEIKKQSLLFEKEGESELINLENEKKGEQTKLNSELIAAEKEMEKLTLLIAEKRIMLNSIEETFSPKEDEIKSMLTANKVVSEEFTRKITNLKNII